MSHPKIESIVVFDHQHACVGMDAATAVSKAMSKPTKGGNAALFVDASGSSKVEMSTNIHHLANVVDAATNSLKRWKALAFRAIEGGVETVDALEWALLLFDAVQTEVKNLQP